MKPTPVLRRGCATVRRSIFPGSYLSCGAPGILKLHISLAMGEKYDYASECLQEVLLWKLFVQVTMQ